MGVVAPSGKEKLARRMAQHVGRHDGGNDAAVLGPDVWRYREAVSRTRDTHLGALTALVGVGVALRVDRLRVAAFPLGALAIEMQQPALARAVPIAVGVIVLIAMAPGSARGRRVILPAAGRHRTRPCAAADACTAWRHGLHCNCCCVGLMAILLVIGVMDPRAMAVVAAAIAVERLAAAASASCEPSGRSPSVQGCF